MQLARRVEPEALDTLSPDDPLAQHARADLQRVHRVMRSASVLRGAIARAVAPATRRQRWLEVGAGDATLLARLAPTLARDWPQVDITLLDRQPCVAPWSRARLAAQGWKVRERAADVFDGLEPDDVACDSAAYEDASYDSAAYDSGAYDSAPYDNSAYDLVIANLFLHHFEGAALQGLLQGIAARTTAFVACEPRRSRAALLGSHLVGVLGANRVTRQDAVLSVHAGFSGQELSALWPAPGWHVEEYAALPFTHCFVARRVDKDHRAL